MGVATGRDLRLRWAVGVGGQIESFVGGHYGVEGGFLGSPFSSCIAVPEAIAGEKHHPR